MDFHSLTRKELQTLCKKNKIPANMTNVAMVDALKALEIVEGIEEFLKPLASETEQSSIESPEKTVITTPAVPRTGCRTSTRRKQIKEVSETLQTLTATTCRRTTRRIAREVEEAKNDVAQTPAAPTTRRTPAASDIQKMKIQLKDNEGDDNIRDQIDREKRVVSETPAEAPNSRRRGLPSSVRRNVETQSRNGKNEDLKEGVVHRVYSTRRSVRLSEKNLSESNLKEKERVEPIKIDSFSSETPKDSEVKLEEGPDDLGEVLDELAESAADMQTILEDGSERSDDLVVSAQKSNEVTANATDLKDDVQEKKSDHYEEGDRSANSEEISRGLDESRVALVEDEHAKGLMVDKEGSDDLVDSAQKSKEVTTNATDLKEYVQEKKSDHSEGNCSANSEEVSRGLDESNVALVEDEHAKGLTVDKEGNEEGAVDVGNKGDDDLEKKSEVGSEKFDELDIHSSNNFGKALDMENEAIENIGTESMFGSATNENGEELNDNKDMGLEDLYDVPVKIEVRESKENSNENGAELSDDRDMKDLYNVEVKVDFLIHKGFNEFAVDVLPSYTELSKLEIGEECNVVSEEPATVPYSENVCGNVLDLVAPQWSMAQDDNDSLPKEQASPFFKQDQIPSSLAEPDHVAHLTHLTPTNKSSINTPLKKSSSNTPSTIRRMSLVSDDKENIDNSGRKLVLTMEKEKKNKIDCVEDNKLKSLNDMSLRQLEKMLKEKLQITNTNTMNKIEENTKDITKMAKSRPALQALSENHPGELGKKN
ncbi:unnamed protein product [Ilex paraguariensis]|uniref:Uncharacterized protein n=1 Tax=Ilex paraguariensis TaxID=185542 RepID=A0ABC8TTF1_9AQUA